MMRRFAALALLLSAPALGEPVRSALSPTPAAKQIFERDWVLMNWALKFFDSNRDILLQPEESSAAGTEFRRIADANGDGRVTPEEYRAAREFILARY
jgi:hypothetical protein